MLTFARSTLRVLLAPMLGLPVATGPGDSSGNAPAARATVARAAADDMRSGEARWKINTHLFAANMALADAMDDGMVTIPPFGSFPVAASAWRALRAAPASYRAGVLSPDLYPDMYVGGWFVHSDLSTMPERWIADNWMRHVWTRARAWQGGAAERDKVMAFAFGFLTHAAGDMFAHTYVNEKADGAWITFTGPARSTAVKHVVLEGFVGEHTPPTDLSIDAWPRFVSNVLIRDPAARQHLNGAAHYQRFLDIYDWLGPLLERAKRDMNANVPDDAPYWVKCTANPVACARKEQLETWRLDINRGFRALVDSSQSLGERLMDGATTEGTSAMTGWMSEWVPKMFGAHAIGEGSAALTEFLNWAGQPLAPISNAIRAEVLRFFEQQFPQYYRLYEAVQRPSYWMDSVGFPAGTRQQVLKEMGVPAGSAAPFDWRSFEPMYNTIILSKLILLDGDGLNELVRRAGLAQPLFEVGDATNIMLGVTRSMTQSYQWMGEVVTTDTRFGICGPEGGASLPTTALCGVAHAELASPSSSPRTSGVAQSRSTATMVRSGGASGGFALWGNTEAREKIFRVIFKGYGPGPGSALASVPSTIPVSTAGTRESARALRAVWDLSESMRETVDILRGKVAGAAPATAARPPAPVAVTRPLPGGGIPATRNAPASSPAAPPVAIVNWGQRCCSKDLAELRAMIASMQLSSRRFSTPALGRRVTAAQLGGLLTQMQAALDLFAKASDSQSASAALDNFGRQVQVLSSLVGGL